ncbi:hypothetical protein HYT23_03950 [Candidatus Pacearchaeota archaeon]|nr:hypothetical protein [Candidatus Pacearchaeota archaeon]
MDNEKVIVALLIVVVLLSVATVGITLGLDLDKVFSKQQAGNPADYVDVNHANVALVIAKTPQNGGST